MEDGPWTDWHKNGHLEEQGEYRLGRKIGLWEFGSETGGSHRQNDHGMPVADLLPETECSDQSAESLRAEKDDQ